MKLVQACLCVRGTVQRRFHLRGGVVKQVQACLNSRKDVERSFHHCGIPVKLVQACFMCGKHHTTPF